MAGGLDERLGDWEARLDRLERRVADHVVFVPSPSGYSLVNGGGLLPAPGDSLDLPGRNGHYRVLRVDGSPLPGDRRRYVYVEAT